MQSTLVVIVVIVAITMQALLLPIPSIHPMQTPDMPINVFIVAATVDVALFLLCPPPAERSLAASSRVAVLRRVGCNPPSLSLSSLSQLHHELCHPPFLVSARRGPQTRPLTCLSLPPPSMSPSPSSACRRSWDSASALSTTRPAPPLLHHCCCLHRHRDDDNSTTMPPPPEPPPKPPLTCP